MSDICCRQKPRAAALARIETPRKSSLISLCISEMITSLRKLLFAVFGLSLILTLTTKLTYRFGVREILNQTLTLGFQRFHSELANPNALNPRPEQSVFNSTLLSLASIELGEADQRQQIAALLETAAYGGRSYRRVTEHDEDASRRRRRPHLTAMQLFHPKFAAFWSEFRRTLRSWSFNKKYAPRVMNELVESVKIPLDKHYFASGMVKNGGRRYGSCAVVGNSGILLSRSHGALIDSHDMVIRLNNARIAGFKDSVGARTTLAFVNSHILHFCSRRTSCFCHPYGEDVPIIMYICQVTHFMDYAFCNASRKAPLLVTDARFDNLCARIVKYYSLKNFVETTGKHPLEWGSAHEGSLFHYSSGMQAVMLALGICDQVSLFGFGKSPDAKHHYHTNQKAELKLHDYEAEYRFYNDLVNRTPYIPFLGESAFYLKQKGCDLEAVMLYTSNCTVSFNRCSSATDMLFSLQHA